MTVTYRMIKELCPGANSYWAEMIAFYFNEYASKYGVNTPARIQHYFAQGAHETGCFTKFVENLNYSAPRLQVVFPRHFPTPAWAKAYASNPERIANRVYANKGGNGDEKSGDGWLYRGRGIFQLTLKDNYDRFGLHVYGEAGRLRPDDVATPILAVRSSLWYYHANGLGQLADDGAFEALTKRINRAGVGMEERRNLFMRAKKIFK